MVFSGVLFLFGFLPALLLAYYIPIIRTRSWRNGVLLLFSLIFYSCGGWRLMPLIVLSIGVNYVCGLLAGNPRWRRTGLWTAVIFDVGMLMVFKYTNFLLNNLSHIIPGLPSPEIVLPIGISFYTFQSMSYVIDVYRGQEKPARNPFHTALYIVLFPQLIAGPIVRYTDVAKDITARRETIEDAAAGIQRFLFGMAKKVLLANPMGEIAGEVFGQRAAMLSTGLAWLGVLAYTAQIYFDFSGYSDMAIGLGRIFGFHFGENFRYPYISQSITEFWRRWHISLSSWFRDYVYIPLGGSRVSRKRQIWNLLAVWSLTGLWHGAAWNFVLWGLFYAVLLMGERWLWGKAVSTAPRPIRHIYAMVLIMLGWLLFRSESLTQVWVFLTAMFGKASDGLWNQQASYLVLQYRWEWLLAVLASLPLKPMLEEKLSRNPEKISILKTAGPPAIALALGGISVIHLVSSGFNPFIYFQF